MDTNARYDAAEHFAADVPATDAAHDDAATRQVAGIARVQQSEIGSGWYHDAAIKSAQEAQAHPYL